MRRLYLGSKYSKDMASKSVTMWSLEVEEYRMSVENRAVKQSEVEGTKC